MMLLAQGGSTKYGEAKGWFKVQVTVRYLDDTRTFPSESDMVDWVANNIAHPILSRI